jgi:PhzF family phenazine biosynthesis protein
MAMEVHRLAAFTDDPDGGNPAGVVLVDDALPDDTMQRVAAEVGYSETAFLSDPDGERRRWTTRYFAPAAEVPFCGHATVAAGVLLGGVVGPGRFVLDTRPGEVVVDVGEQDGRVVASLTSVAPTTSPAPPALLEAVLATCGLGPAQLDPSHPPAVADAGARHLLLFLRAREVLRDLSYDFAALRELMLAAELTTVAVLWGAPDGSWDARNLFPVGGVVEDPATGAAAAALGGHLRRTELLRPPATFVIRQGVELGRPSLLTVTVPPGDGGIEVSGTAVRLDD